MTEVETVKLLLIGNSSAGKSSLLLRFIHNAWEPEDTQATIGVDFKTATVPISPDRRVRATLWDTAGQERFRTLTSSYYRGCAGVLLVFDLTSRASFEQVDRWRDELDLHTDHHTRPVLFLVGNKADGEARAVTAGEAETRAAEVGADAYREVSAKLGGPAVVDLFHDLVRAVVARKDAADERDDRRGHGGQEVRLDDVGGGDGNGNCAC